MAEPTPGEDVVDAYLAGVEEADSLAATDTTNVTARTNPRTLQHQMASQDALHRELIDLEDARARLSATREHERELERARREQRWAQARDEREDRAIREATADATEAAEDLAAIRGWEREESPATAARRVSRARTRWAREFLAFSVVASAVSALGLASLVMAAMGAGLWAAVATGVAVETVLTVLVTRIIAFQAHLDTNRKGERPKEGLRGEVYPWVLMVGLLSISVALNGAGLVVGTGLYGVVGMVGAVVAALCAGMAWVSSNAAADVIAVNVEAFQGSEWKKHRAELHQRAAGGDIPHPETSESLAEGGQEGDTPAAALDADALAEQTAQIVAQRVMAHLTGGTASPDPSQDPELAPQDQEFFAGLDAQMREAEWGPSGGGTAVVEGGELGGEHPGSEPHVHRGVNAEPSSPNGPSIPGVNAGGPASAFTSSQEAFTRGRTQANTARAQRAQRRIAEAIAALEAEGAEPTISAVRKHTGMHLNTIRRHWQAVVTNPDPKE
ncbi:tripartite tricarboxylate transporter TctB family protein [Halostreptopolyspora alba]|uniref:tripartite tricarboxylate transporter TctB family protein n=1 Tax=Halostreptopolyspora alba TaxID=2487137 RepID=UPI0011CE15CB